jgi:hypothetical protein
MIKLVVMLICAALYFIGGLCFLPARRFIMPFVIALACAFFTGVWWAFFLPLPMIGCLCIGYGEDSWLRKILPDAIARAVWGFLVAITASFGLLMAGFLPLWAFMPYLAVNLLLNGLLVHWKQVIADPILGLGFSSLILFV